ncbi:hypothetical protein Athai_54430 [Actinocatenispora thailandica]|uniref:Uncharacterized protein n=1 Tax=Actinocatenispora thailandica TaxID=227318 RepID=A0A7R7DUI5_9ACTN|nr:hypothetical protein Athai_54430 [Actinocatenispora thailandica]
MVRHGTLAPEEEPPDGADVLLWRSAQRMLRTHRPDPVDSTRCGFAGCLRPEQYPCPARRIAEAALTLSLYGHRITTAWGR